MFQHYYRQAKYNEKVWNWRPLQPISLKLLKILSIRKEILKMEWKDKRTKHRDPKKGWKE